MIRVLKIWLLEKIQEERDECRESSKVAGPECPAIAMAIGAHDAYLDTYQYLIDNFKDYDYVFEKLLSLLEQHNHVGSPGIASCYFCKQLSDIKAMLGKK